MASKGTQNIAETGNPAVMEKEVMFNCGKNCGKYIQTPCMPPGSGTCKAEFQFVVSRWKPLISFATMVRVLSIHLEHS